MQLPIAAPPVSKCLHKSVVSCMERLLTKVEKKVKNEQQQIIEDLRKKKNDQKGALDTEVVEVLPPSMPDMKQVDLCNKHRRFVPDMCCESLCPELAKKQ